MKEGRFYAGVGVLIQHAASGKYLLLKRSADKDFAGNVWECVTGRVDQGEGFEEAAYREVYEETGIADFRLGFMLGTTHFYRGEARPENELVGVIYTAFVDDPNAVQISSEHAEYRWLTAVEALNFLPTDSPSAVWIRQVVQRAEAIKSHLPDELVEFNQQNGFELG
ncbi:MAG: NUDIX domain-containing protein [Chloroflexi bacterium]|nr:NUDIX domain-containing protein [Chloroflexota bacterium]